MNFLCKTFSIVFLLAFNFSFNAYANPQGENVVAGSASFDRSVPNTLTVTTSSKNTIIDYNSFNIASNETTRFDQPDAGSAVLNRVVGVDPSLIYGTLSSNGKLFLVNPNGILFGPHATVNAPAVLASTLDISNNDFLNGNYQFFKNGASSYIINQGSLAASPGGYIVLLSQAVHNQGIIVAPLGSIALASGNQMTVGLDSQSLISVAVGDAVKDEVLGPDGQKITNAIENSGTISANGGRVLLTSKVLNDVFDQAVNNSGIIQADSIEEHKGEVEFVASGASVVNTGKVQGGQVSIADTDSSVGIDSTGSLVASGAMSLTADGNITSKGTLESSSLYERGNTFKVGGIFDPGNADVKNADNAIEYTADAQVSGSITDPADITVDPGVTLTMTDDTSFNAGDAFTMDPTSTIDGGGHDLSLSALNASSLGNINNVDLLTLSLVSGSTPVTFTSNSSSTFQVNTVKTDNGALLSRSVGTGTSADPIMIYSDSNAPGGLEYINSSGLGLDYQQANNIDASETSSWNSGAGFVPIGSGNNMAFGGSYNGENYQISKLFINSAGNNVGLFGYTSSTAQLTGIRINGGDIQGQNVVGGLVGINLGSISYSYSSANVEGVGYEGGLVGLNGGQISNSYATGDIISSYQLAGGLVGNNSGGSITDSYSSGNVIGDNEVGGLVGENDYGPITNSFTVSDITATGSYIGGLTGYNNSGTITNSYYTDNTYGSQGGTYESAGPSAFYSTSHAVYDIGNPGQWDLSKWNFTGGLLPIQFHQVSGYIWIGVTSNDWYTSSNWFNGLVPGTGADVTIDPAVYSPVLTSNINVSNFLIEPGAVFDPGNYMITGIDLDIYGMVKVNTATVAENYSVMGNANMETGSTVIYSGSDQTVATYIPYYNLSLSANGTKTLDAPSLSVQGDITFDPGATLSLGADTSLYAGNAIGMDPAATINGNGHNLTVSANSNSTLGNINNVGLFTLSPGSGSNVTFTSNPISSFQVNTVKTDNGALLSRSVGTGTSADPIMIYSDSNAPGGLEYINTSGLGLDYQQANNIDASETSSWGGGAGFVPIGQYTPFSGIFNGNNQTISNLTLNGTYVSNIGLFGQTSATAQISNVNINNVDIIAGYYDVAGLVGYNNGAISNSSVNGNVNGNTYVGGLVGYNLGSITGSSSNANVSGSSDVGGLVGYNNSTGSVNDTNSEGAVGGSSSIGGLVGINEGTVENSYSTAAVNGSDSVAGLVGENDSSGTISNSNSSGAVTGSDSDIGGLVGINFGSVSTSYSSSNVTGGNSSFVGGLIGFDNGGAIDGMYSTGNVSASGDYVGGLVGFSSVTISNSYSTGNVSGSGTYVGGLVGMNRASLTGSYTLGSVSGSQYVGGLVGENYNTTIANSFAIGTVSAVGTTSDAGGLVGYNYGGTVSDSFSSGIVSGNADVGGFVGNNYYGSVTNSYSVGSVTGSSYAGGLLGLSTNSTVTNSYYTDNAYGSQGGGTYEPGGASAFYSSSHPVYAIGSPGGWDTSTWSFSGGLPALSYQLSTYIWIGSTSTDWLTASNWLNGTVPGAGADITIDAGNYNPVLPSDVSTANFLVEPGAVFDPSSFKLSGTNLDAYGTLMVNASTFAANYSFSATTTLETGSTVNYAGGSGQTISSALSYFNLTTSGSGTKTLEGSTTVALDLTNNSILDLNGQALTVAGTLTNNGTLMLLGSETPSIGTFIDNGLTDYYGSDAYNIEPLGTYNNLQFDNGIFIVDASFSAHGNITFNANTILELVADVSLAAGNSLTMDPSAMIVGPDHNLTLTAGNNSTLGYISANLLTLNSSSASDIMFTSDPNSTFQVNTVKTDYGTLLSRSVGTGTSTDPIMIYSDSNAPGGLQYISTSGLGLYYQQANNINASETSSWNSGEGFIPIGNSTTPFTGSYDGQSYAIQSLVINTANDYAGLFGYTSSTAVLSGVQLNNGNVMGGNYVGGLVGYNEGTINYSFNTGNVSGISYVGGLVGFNAGSINNTYNTGNVSSSGNFAGGLVGYNNSGSIGDSYSSGNVTGSDYVGGLVGDNLAGITNSFSVGNVTGSGINVGGLTGNNGGTIINSYFTDDVNGGQGGGIYEPGGPPAFYSTSDAVYAVGNAGGWIFTGYPELPPIPSSPTWYPPMITPTNSLPKLSNTMNNGEDENGNNAYIWLGLKTSYWNNPFNWENKDIPPVNKELQKNIIITDGRVNTPVLPGPIILGEYNLIIDAGAGLDPGSNQIKGNTLYLKRSSTLLVSFSNGTFSNNYLFSTFNIDPGSYVEYIGNDQFIASNVTYGNLKIIGNGGTTVDYGNSFTANGYIQLGSDVTLTMTGDTDLTAGNAFNMVSNASINGVAYNLSISAGSNSTLGNIYGVNQFTLSSGSSTDVTFTSNSDSKFIVNTVQTNYHSILSRSVGTGTSTDPILIYSDSNAPGGLQYINTSGLGLYYEQANNIIAVETSNWNSGAGFVPLGNDSMQFTGSFNGENFTISNLEINAPSNNYIGLFGETSSTAVLSNIQLINDNITGNSYVGGLVGLNLGSITNASASGSVTGPGGFVGGLVGGNNSPFLNTSDGSISNSFSTGIVSGGFEDVGGLVGQNWSYGSIFNSYSTASVSGVSYGDTYNVGGLVGENLGSISNSYAAGPVSGFDSIGGLVGSSYYGSITNTYAIGPVNGSNLVGGLVGSDGQLNPITNSYATGSVTGSGAVGIVGGLVGNASSPITNSFSTGIVSGNADVGGFAGEISSNLSNCAWWTGAYQYAIGNTDPSNAVATPAPTLSSFGYGTDDTAISDFYSVSEPVYAGWDFTNTWIMSGNSYPTLRT